MDSWLKHSPTSDERMEVFEMCTTALKREHRFLYTLQHEQKEVAETVSLSLSYLTSSIEKIGAYKFPDMLGVVMSYMLDASRSGELPVGMWHRFSHLPFTDLDWDRITTFGFEFQK